MRSRRILAVLAAGILAVGACTAKAAWSAFSGETANPNNQMSAGTVILTDNSGGQALFTVSGLRPGVAVSRCVRVVYEGTVGTPAVKLFGTTTGGSGLAGYLMMSVTRGEGVTGAFPDCTGFTPDPTDYNLLGPGVLYSGPLTGYPADRATGLADPTGTWTLNETHWYQVTVDVLEHPAALGRSVTHTLSWDAR